MVRFLRNDKILFLYCHLFFTESAARLERKSFFACTQVLLKLKSSCKKDWEWKTEKLPKKF
ncbi:hypothetical protein IO89_14075 [Epilithonimonas lactis]|uniref:Uncharacterized protein n=1 Tax=Epilithonimonas lactis TaxID=421072 RepID=A0A085BFS2_9FLAO|nr:hypothetical protein IO89_14075 [Epilithonimonas lactis]